MGRSVGRKRIRAVQIYFIKEKKIRVTGRASHSVSKRSNCLVRTENVFFLFYIYSKHDGTISTRFGLRHLDTLIECVLFMLLLERCVLI